MPDVLTVDTSTPVVEVVQETPAVVQVVQEPVTVVEVATIFTGANGGVTDADLAAAITDHVNDTSPHPVYDDMPSTTLIFENGLI
jgi:hypothetical protein